MNGNPAEVSLYLGLATVIASFSAASVLLGLLECRRARERAVSVGVMLLATVGIAAALITVARGRTTGFGNILIGAGVLAAAVFVLARAMRHIFTVHEVPRRAAERGAPPSSTSTRPVPVVWTMDAHVPDSAAGEKSVRPAGLVRPGPFWATSAAFIVAVVIASAAAAPDVRDLLHEFLRSRPVGTPTAESGVPNDPQSVVARHLKLIEDGDVAGAYELFTPAMQAEVGSDWVRARAAAVPTIKLDHLGSAWFSHGAAFMDIRFYTRDEVATPGSDTSCRRFAGTVVAEKVDGQWRYAANRNSLRRAVLPRTASGCPGGSPRAVVTRFFKLLASGHAATAFALFTPVEQSRVGPSWVGSRAAAKPAIRLVHIGAPDYSGGAALMRVKFYARDTRRTPLSDRLCRRFTGTVVAMKLNGQWRYAADRNALQSATLPNRVSECP